MRIGIDARLWFESGVGRYIRNIVQGIEKTDNINEYVIFLSKKGFEEVNFSSQNFKKVLTTSPWHTVSEQISFRKQLDKERLDLVHFPYFAFPVFYKGAFVLTIHDLILDHFSTGKATTLPLPLYLLKRQGYKFITRKGIRNAEKIIVPSHATKDEIIKHYSVNKQKVEVIYEGVDPRITARESSDLVTKRYLLYVGNAYPHKNLQSLLSVFAEIRKAEDIELVCIGKNDYFYQDIKKDDHPGVHFLHSIDDSTLSEYYKGALCLVMPSFMEGFGLPLLEAMNFSCPVVASNTAALKEIAQDAAIYFDPQNREEIKDAILKLLHDKEQRKTNVKKGLLRSREFSWEKAVKETLRVYESCNRL